MISCGVKETGQEEGAKEERGEKSMNDQRIVGLESREIENVEQVTSDRV